MEIIITVVILLWLWLIHEAYNAPTFDEDDYFQK